MSGFTSKKRFLDTSMSFSTLITHENHQVYSNGNRLLASRVANDIDSSILPGLPDDVAKYCLALVPRRYLPAMGAVCKKWRSFLKTKEFITVRKLAGLLEEWLFLLPPMPGFTKAGFGVVVLNGKLLVMAGYSVIDGTGTASADVYEYDCYLNSWSKLSAMNVARYDFACAEVNGKVYAAGGYGTGRDSLSSVEMYDPETGSWTLIESLRRPRWGCFACGFDGKLYVMGGRSTFTIGNSRFVEVYDPEKHTWCEMKNGRVITI
ncbi:hypothetical protein D5086_019392 [Populus alba]|uniref:Uncharacterized protein n=1 Tax=Populus alba TaxID=43335 RepID=A0ACC4BH24_POPAL